MFARVVGVLGSIGTPAAIRQLQETYDEIRTRQALEAFLEGLSKATHPNVIPFYIQVLKQEDSSARFYAWSGLAQHGKKELMPYRLQILPYVEAGMQDVKQVPDVPQVVGRVRHDSGTIFFLPFLKTMNVAVRDAVRDALAAAGDEEKDRLLMILCDKKRPRDLRLHAYEATLFIAGRKRPKWHEYREVADRLRIDWLEQAKGRREP